MFTVRGLIREATWDVPGHLFRLSLFATAIVETGVITGQWKMASCAPPHLIYTICVSSYAYNFHPVMVSDQTFVLSLNKLKHFHAEADNAFEKWKHHVYRFNWSHETCCISSIMQRLQPWEDVWIIYTSCYIWFRRSCSQGPLSCSEMRRSPAPCREKTTMLI